MQTCLEAGAHTCLEAVRRSWRRGRATAGESGPGAPPIAVKLAMDGAPDRLWWSTENNDTSNREQLQRQQRTTTTATATAGPSTRAAHSLRMTNLVFSV